jgi:hypothetical protein
MKDETVDTESAPFDDFDLDSFLRENNFLVDKDKKNAQDNTKRSIKRTRRRADVSRSDAAEVDANNVERIDTSVETPEATQARAKRTTGDTASGSTEDTTTNNTTITNNNNNNTNTNTNTTPARPRATRNKKANLNATMSYEALGEDYPEIPFVKEEMTDSKAERNGKSGAKGGVQSDAKSNVKDKAQDDAEVLVGNTAKVTRARTRSASTARSSDSQSERTDVDISEKKTRKRSRPSTKATLEADAASSTSRPTSATGARAKVTRATGTRSSDTRVSDTRAINTRAARSSSAKKQVQAEAPKKGRTSARREPRLAALANPRNFHQAEFTDNSYHIRGGGTRHNRRSPLMTILMAVVILIGIGLLWFSLTSVSRSLLSDKPEETVITLSAIETRTAIDEQMPRLIDYIDNSPEGTYAAFTEAGDNAVMDPRVSANNPDKTAVGNEIIHLSSSVEQSALEQGYYEGEFDAYNFDELQQLFNGAWMLDISQGDLGSFVQIEYVNFAAESLDREMQYLRGFQGLADENSVVDTQGTDTHGNTYIQGYSVIEEITYYWQLIGITLKEYYGGQDRRDLPDTAVFVKGKVANFDFYGAGSSFTEDEA